MVESMESPKPRESMLQKVEITRSPSGRRLAHPIVTELPFPLTKADENLQKFVMDSFSCKMCALVAFTLLNQSATLLAKRIMISNSSSKPTLYQYMYGVYRYCNYLSKKPEEIISECKTPDGEMISRSMEKQTQLLTEFVIGLQGLAPGTINNYVKGVKAFFLANALRLELPSKPTRRIVYKDRSPTPEELQLIMDIASLREKVIVNILAS